MSTNIENEICYYCDETYSSFSGTNNNIFVCYHCEDILGALVNIQEYKNECCVCLQEKNKNIKLNCNHITCLECYKTIYFGSSTIQIPTHYNEIIDVSVWPYDEDIHDDYEEKHEEYWKFEDKYFDFENKTYEELIMIRDSLISERPEWMNTPEMIDYENKHFRYDIEVIKCEKEWDNYNKNKTIGNKKCPLCRK